MPHGSFFGWWGRERDEPRPAKVGRPKRDRAKQRRRRSGR